MYFSLSDAANKVGMSRSSIYRLIDEGKLSATTDRRGRKVVELTELLRVFGSIEQVETTRKDTQEDKKNTSVRSIKNTGQDTSGNITSVLLEVEQLRSQLQLKDMELKLKDKELAFVAERMNDLKQASEQVNQEKNRLLEIIERQSLLLTAPRPKTSEVAKKTVTPATQTKARRVSKPRATPPAVQEKSVAKKAVTTPTKRLATTKPSTPPKKATVKKKLVEKRSLPSNSKVNAKKSQKS